jgi:hypothetical protein
LIGSNGAAGQESAMNFFNGAKERSRTVTVSALSILLALALCGFSINNPTVAQTAGTYPDQGCTAKHPTRQPLETDIPEEVPHLLEIVVCSGIDSAGTTTSIITNKSNAVWVFLNRGTGHPTFRLLSGRKSKLFRSTVAQKHLYEYAYIAPSDTMNLPPDVEWHMSPMLTGTWLTQDVYQTLFKKVMKMKATKLLAGKSKSRTALIQCGFSAYGSLTERGVSGASTSDAVLQVFDDVSTAGTCASALKNASHEIGSSKVTKLVHGVKVAGEATETIGKIHIGWDWIRSFCLAVKYC